MADDQKKEEEKKIIVDDDWKTEAKKEKEVLAAQEEVEKKEAESQKHQGPLPPGNFAALVSMLVTQALFALGLVAVEGDQDQKKEPDLALAKYNIDMLETLEEKTKGNLSEEEQKILENMLGQVRMAYVKITG